MKFRAPLISSIIDYFGTFRKFIGNKFFILLFIMVIAGFAEGIGITLFLPLLTEMSVSAAGSDNIFLKVYHNIFSALHIPYSLNFIFLFILFVFLAKFLIQAVQAVLMARITSEHTEKLRKSMIDAYSKMDYQYYLNSTTGFLNNLVTNEIFKASGSVNYFCASLAAIVFIFIYLVFSVFLDWQITVLAAVSGLGVLYLLKSLFSYSRTLSKEMTGYDSVLQNQLIQFIQNFKYLKATDSFAQINRKLYMCVESLANIQFKANRIKHMLIPLPETITVVFTLALIFFQVSVLGKNVASALVVFALFYRILTKVTYLQAEWQNFCSFAGSIEVVSKAFRDINARKELPGSKQPEGFKREIKTEGLTFSFGDKKILDNINVKIARNSAVAIVGESGSGKSTLINLIAGILRPVSGHISYDGIDYSDIDIFSLRKKIGFVTQEGVVFSDSVANNISLWRAGSDGKTDMEKIKLSARQAGLEPFINGLPQRYDEVVGDRGLKLSGGQRQRLAIARELFKEPEILIMDEATSSLDTESEVFVQKSIDVLRGTKTLVIIAHRLSTVKSCDYIYVLKNGKVIEEGSFHGLYNNERSKFREMCRLQNF